MGHEAHFILVDKEKAKDSFEARNLTSLILEKELDERILGEDYEFNIGGDFSGILSDACGGKVTTPYYNIDMRKAIRENISGTIPWIKENIDKSNTKSISIKPKDLKKDMPEFEKYSDSDLLDALRLELYSIGINVDINRQKITGDILYTFDYELLSPNFWQNMWEGGRYRYAELGYEDDAMIVNECTFREVIEAEEARVIDLEKSDITPENIIGKRWIVVVDQY